MRQIEWDREVCDKVVFIATIMNVFKLVAFIICMSYCFNYGVYMF